MLSIFTQTAIAVLHDVSSGTALQSANFLLSGEDWKDLFALLEKGQLIRLLPGREATAPSSYELCRLFTDISLLDVRSHGRTHPLQHAPPEAFYLLHGQIAKKIGVFNQVACTFLATSKYPTGKPVNKHLSCIYPSSTI